VNSRHLGKIHSKVNILLSVQVLRELLSHFVAPNPLVISREERVDSSGNFSLFLILQVYTLRMCYNHPNFFVLPAPHSIYHKRLIYLCVDGFGGDRRWRW
jgi:hypothetical protein